MADGELEELPLELDVEGKLEGLLEDELLVDGIVLEELLGDELAEGMLLAELLLEEELLEELLEDDELLEELEDELDDDGMLGMLDCDWDDCDDWQAENSATRLKTRIVLP